MSARASEPVRMAAFLPRSSVNGPGIRAVIWAQGCALPRCPGCFNPGFLDPKGPSTRIDPDALAEQVLAVGGLRGVTLSGGEPFDQAGPLAKVAARLRREGLDVVVFTGNTLESLRARHDADIDALLSETDLLVAGPYRREEPCAEPLRSSRNQRLHYLGRIAEDEVADLAAVEVAVDSDGNIAITGFPPPSLAATLRR